MDAFATDVRPLLAELREEQGLDGDPMAAYLRSGYADRIAAERGLAAAGVGMGRVTPRIAELLDRCHRLGSDRRNTNYAGGNASAKVDVRRPGHGRHRPA